MKRPSQRLISDWYDRLRREGFVDLEKRRNKAGQYYDAPSTYQHHERSLDGDAVTATVLQENLDVFGRPTSAWDTPVAEHHRARAAKVADRPQRSPEDNFVADLANRGSLIRSARENGLTKWQGRVLKKRFFQ